MNERKGLDAKEKVILSKELLTNPAPKRLHSGKTNETELATAKETTADRFLRLQRALGNRRLADLIRTNRVSTEARIVDDPSSRPVGEIESRLEKDADHVANAVISNQYSAPRAQAITPAIQRKPAQTPAQTPAEADWGSKKWGGKEGAYSENEWNAFYQLAIQGLASSELKPEKATALAAEIADFSMMRCLHHGEQVIRAKNAVSDEDSKTRLDLGLTWGEGSKGLWGSTFRSALQSTTGGVHDPHSAHAAVLKAEDFADWAARRFIGENLWKLYTNPSNSPAPPPQSHRIGRTMRELGTT